jgi:trigger factor
MQIEVKEIEHCKLSIHYEADALEILNKKSEIINNFKKALVPGFRPGRATSEAISIHYRQQIEDSLKRALAEDAFHNALFEKKIKPHGAPLFNGMLFTGGKFSCDFDVFTKPEFDLSEFKGMDVPKPAEVISSVELSAKMMQELRVRFGDVSPYTEEDFVMNGDNIILDYEGVVDGQKVDSISAEGEMLTVGASALTEFDANLLGMKMGETREFTMVVPESGMPSLAGKTVQFKVTVSMGSRTVPCALDDEMAVKLGKKDFEELNAFVNATASGRVANNLKTAINESVCNKLVEANKIDVPNWMSISEAKYLAHQSKLDWETLEDADKERFLVMSKKNVTLSLVLDKIREQELEAQLTDQEVFEIIKQNLAKSKTANSVDEVIQEMNRTGYLQILFSRIRDEYTLDFIVKSVRIVE